MMLNKWLFRDLTGTGEQAGVSTTGSVVARELRCRNRLLQQEVQVLRRAAAYLSRANSPGKGSTRSWASSPLTGFPWW